MVTLDTKFANKIIEKVKQYTDYNINIMNERGI
ncbi:sugar diacid recognition domain-containing protein, partial [Enterocloster citroniae]